MRFGVSMSYETWEAIGHQLIASTKAMPWWIGDWLNYGEKTYGERYAQAIEMTGLSYQHLSDLKWVANAVPPSERSENLSWTHHRAVAHLTKVKRSELLARAESEKLSSADLKRIAPKARGPKEKAEPARVFLLLFRATAPTQQWYAERELFPTGEAADLRAAEIYGLIQHRVLQVELPPDVPAKPIPTDSSEV